MTRAVKRTVRWLVVAALGGLALLATPGAPAYATVSGFPSVQGSSAWIDFNGDGLADSCRVANNSATCTLATGTGFGGSPSFTGDPGYSSGRAWADVNGDRRADYCRIVGGGYQYLQCTLSTGAGWGATFTSGAVDPGWDAGRAWVDVDGDGRADYCRVVGSGNKEVQCTLSTGAGWGATFTSAALDPGYDAGRSWVDVNGDGKADYCRVVGGVFKYMQCTLSTGTGFGQTITSAALDPGYDDSRSWADVNGDGKADYCRIVGSAIYSATTLRCTVSTGIGFGAEFTSPTLDAGYGGTGRWTDVNGDGRDDYCRITGYTSGTCTLSTGGGFGVTFSTPPSTVLTVTAGWADFNGDHKADFCRWVSSQQAACTVSLGSSFGTTFTGP